MDSTEADEQRLNLPLDVRTTTGKRESKKERLLLSVKTDQLTSTTPKRIPFVHSELP